MKKLGELNRREFLIGTGLTALSPVSLFGGAQDAGKVTTVSAGVSNSIASVFLGDFTQPTGGEEGLIEIEGQVQGVDLDHIINPEGSSLEQLLDRSVILQNLDTQGVYTDPKWRAFYDCEFSDEASEQENLLYEIDNELPSILANSEIDDDGYWSGVKQSFHNFSYFDREEFSKHGLKGIHTIFDEHTGEIRIGLIPQGYEGNFSDINHDITLSDHVDIEQMRSQALLGIHDSVEMYQEALDTSIAYLKTRDAVAEVVKRELMDDLQVDIQTITKVITGGDSSYVQRAIIAGDALHELSRLGLYYDPKWNGLLYRFEFQEHDTSYYQLVDEFESSFPSILQNLNTSGCSWDELVNLTDLLDDQILKEYYIDDLTTQFDEETGNLHFFTKNGTQHTYTIGQYTTLGDFGITEDITSHMQGVTQIIQHNFTEVTMDAPLQIKGPETLPYKSFQQLTSSSVEGVLQLSSNYGIQLLETEVKNLLLGSDKNVKEDEEVLLLESHLDNGEQAS